MIPLHVGQPVLRLTMQHSSAALCSAGDSRIYVSRMRLKADHQRFVMLLLVLLVGCTVSREGKVATEPLASDTIELKSDAGPVTMQIRLWPKEPRLSDLVELEIEVGAETGVVIRPPAFGEAVGDFLVRDYTERSPKKRTEQSKPNQRVFHYQLEPVHTGTHLIRSIAIEFIDNRENSEQKGLSSWIESEPVEVKVTSELGDQVPSFENLEPMAQPRAIEESIRWWWLLGALLISGAVFVYFRRLRSRVKSVTEFQPTAEEIAHSQLEKLLAENLPSRGMFKDFYLRLTGIVRHYIEGITGLRAPEQTTEEFLREMGKQEIFSSVQSRRLKEFLEAADMVKYAGQQPDTLQIDTSTLRAKEFIDMKPIVILPEACAADLDLGTTQPERES